ncbi:MAG: sugar phosphate isomerase/epimerase, partial [Armatimonadota bacterium]|nr:sugar phosphate isomerase/epimerase [Armatimonadota bacterium]
MAPKRPVVALQLYTLRDLTKTDMAGALRQVAGMGYEGIEPAGFGNLTAPEIKNLCDELGLTVVGNHTGFEALRNNFEAVVADNQTLGNQFIVCPSIPAEQRTAEGYKQFAQTLNEFGQKLRDAGMQLCYHNHAFEFEQFDGRYGLDILYENSDPELVQAEIDTYWVQKGGVSPTEYIRKYAGRTPLIHVKDMADDEKQSFAEVGTGTLDWPSIFHAAEAGGAVAYIVEQDVCPGNPLDSVRLSLENLKKMGKLKSHINYRGTEAHRISVT